MKTDESVSLRCSLIACWIILGLGLSGCQKVSASWTFGGIPAFGTARSQEPEGKSQAPPDDSGKRLSGRVIDARTFKPIPEATLFHNGASSKPDATGAFQFEKSDISQPLLIKASGYRQTSVNRPEGFLEIALKPFEAKGLYLTHFGVGYRLLREQVFGLIRSTDLNAVVIDVKGDRGFLSSRYEVPLADEIGATKSTTVKDIRALIENLHRQEVYVIGRIVVFKDDKLANAKPELAIIDARTGRPWIDNEHLAWVDPFQKHVWDYNIQIAVEAAKAGFDEIQFDYIRFPTDGRLSAAKYSQPNTMENRVKTVDNLLETARRALLPYNVYLSADLFGYTPWNYNDTDIGQKIEDVSKHVDYLCLMVYPSAYHLGIPGYLQPVQHPYEVVYRTLEQAKKRLGGQEKKLRPWLQNFRDYAFDRRPFTGTEIRLQIDACKDASTSGYLLWDPSNKYRYTADAMSALKSDSRQPVGRANRAHSTAQ